MNIARWVAPALLAAAVGTSVPAHAGQPIGAAVDDGLLIAGAAVALTDIDEAHIVNLAVDRLRHSYRIYDPDQFEVGVTALVDPGTAGPITPTREWTKTGLYMVESSGGSSGFMVVVAAG